MMLLNHLPLAVLLSVQTLRGAQPCTQATFGKASSLQPWRTLQLQYRPHRRCFLFSVTSQDSNSAVWLNYSHVELFLLTTAASGSWLIGSSRLEKTSKIKSSRHPSTAKSTHKPCPWAPSPFQFFLQNRNKFWWQCHINSSEDLWALFPMRIKYAVLPLCLSNSFEGNEECCTTHPRSAVKLWV